MRKPILSSPLRSVYVSGLLGCSFLLTACGALRDDEGRPLTTLNPKGKQAQRIDDLATPVFIVAAVVFVLVEGGVLYMAWRFRRRKDDVDGELEPIQNHGNPKLEWAWTIAPAILLLGLGLMNVRTIWQLEEVPKDHMTVEVYGQQWWWEFRYDTDNDGKADIITANQMVVPVGKHVELTIRSNDVIHSFWIPALNGKKDAVPGHSNKWSLQADEEGLFQGTCTEYCGLSHAYMRMEVKAVSPAKYEEWVDAQTTKASVPPASDTLATQGYEEFKTNCANCHQVNGESFKFAEKTDGKPNLDYGGADHPLISGNAPNLTHLMSRNKFAGNLFDLYTTDPNTGETVPDDSVLGSWLRDPGAMKPAAADQNRGMPNLNLSQEQIDALVAYLHTLK
ncbi:MAG TPA: cytochrome c oxidase subunit II [Acidimicrobiaceae bacterium]|nr:cytochrome c oxidase subunit II [Acidimicrobiaceae bacterium]